ncbi:MAG: hypothetical protein ACLQIB_33045 [Isosphaeraceae bacterium]
MIPLSRFLVSADSLGAVSPGGCKVLGLFLAARVAWSRRRVLALLDTAQGLLDSLGDDNDREPWEMDQDWWNGGAP